MQLDKKNTLKLLLVTFAIGMLSYFSASFELVSNWIVLIPLFLIILLILPPLSGQ
jgi:hypothetical protein